MKKSTLLGVGTLMAGIAYGSALKYYYDYCFKRRKTQENVNPDSGYYKAYQKAMASVEAYQEVSIQSKDGLKLAGYYFDHHSKDTIILVHGYRVNGFLEYADYLKMYENMNILVIDQRSHGKSEGKWIDFGYQEKDDLLRWSAYLKQTFPYENLYYMGISMGASTVIYASGESLEGYHVKGIVADCGYDTLQHEVTSVMKQMKIPGFLFYKPVDFIHKLHVGHSVSETRPIDGIKKTSVPVLIIHGSEDHFVPSYMAINLYQACKSTKKLYLVKDAHHASSHRVDKQKYEQTVLDFIQRTKC